MFDDLDLNCTTSEVTKDVGIDCNQDEPYTKGYEQYGIIINRNDIDWTGVKYGKRSNIISELKLKEGKRGFKIVVPPKLSYNGTVAQFEAQDTFNTYSNTFVCNIVEDNPEVTGDVIDGFMNGTFVVILFPKAKGLTHTGSPGWSFSKIMGFYQGLEQTDGILDKNDSSTGGGWSITLTETDVPKSSLWFYNTNFETSVSLLEGLTVVETGQEQS